MRVKIVGGLGCRLISSVLCSLLSAIAAPTPASATCPDSVCTTYDELGRLTQADYEDGRTIEYTYDAAGNRTSVVRTAVSKTAPVAGNDSFPIVKDTAGTFDPRGNDTDADGDPLDQDLVLIDMIESSGIGRSEMKANGIPFS
ncbi:MAG: hypothetical protein HXY25_04655 [Alphaproteobacteria bacterium]|nr:hypothetical protein [Alphaproteobacteria bacterium]